MDQDQFVVTFDAKQMSVEALLLELEKTKKGPRLADHQTPSKQEHAVSATPPEVAAARNRAQAENKLLILDFSASWCGPCQRLLMETFVDVKVKRLLQQVELLTIDADEQADYCQSQDVSSLPDVRFYSPDGTLIDRITEFVDAEQFAERLEKHLQARTEGIPDGKP